ncbi:hypothetical protein [Lignipirellula cremea]|uniref:Bacterial type II/III secretion system short domain protein n=1 Tax=Lignipirellula cremea TaxID=2528010 RepID=A0A518E4Y1_9BACT|nr:hypothetical protein [Lignipirellula cremea]QDU99139.1 hypothetical protein Pla8534_70500 [Lignipirellula cremea]
MLARIALSLCLAFLFAGFSGAQPVPRGPEGEEPPAIPRIAEEPKTVDPSVAMPRELAVKATHDFSDSSLREVVAWLQNDQKLAVLLDTGALSKAGVSLAEPVSDRLHDEAVYLLLNRLRSLGLAWYFEDSILTITTPEVAESVAATLPYNVGDLLDAGYDMDLLTDLITSTLQPDSWEEIGGEGVISALGDVLFVRQNGERQREVQGFLAALRKHARQTFVNDPAPHVALRAKLDQHVTVDFSETPLATAVEQLSKITQADIRLDRRALRHVNVREREPVTLKLHDRNLKTAIQGMLLDLELTFILRDGVLWITSPDEAQASLRTAVYDVRDLCRDEGESDALAEAISSQTAPESWEQVGGPGAIHFGLPGVMVVTQEERLHANVLKLLETYRTALRESKPRTRESDKSNKVTTVYYRVHTAVARDLATLLPRIVRPDSWKTDARPEAPGEITVVSSSPEMTILNEANGTGEKLQIGQIQLVLSRSVMLIRQTGAAHDEIAEVIHRVENGDVMGNSAEGFGGGMGGGGFGGGFFSVPAGGR